MGLISRVSSRTYRLKMTLKNDLNNTENSEETLNQFLNSLKDHEPVIPDEITRYFISKGGIEFKNNSSSLKGGAGKEREDKLILDVEDLDAALEEFGLGCKKPPYLS